MPIRCVILLTGDLLTLADNETRASIADQQAAGRDYWGIMADLFEPYSCNGSFAPFDASQANPFVGLTDSPCIAECLDYGGEGNASIDGRFWYSPNYAFTNELDELKTRGRFVWKLAA